ncbi:hypothetical protein [Exiguobacterium sp. s133]|uniref:hypothetical protein n=1 Tax=Exiguobacterium sp. s133 TaxID=2751213 RepID=UPI001BE912F3|nr:hypothetical protein [Exiguobacterium sp. s133]
MKSVDQILSEITVSNFDYGEALDNLLREAKKDQDSLVSQLSKIDRLQEDVLHIIELDNLNASKIMQQASNLKKIRNKRRDIKKRIEEYDSIKNHLNNIKKDATNATDKFKRTKIRLGQSRYVLREFTSYKAQNEEEIISRHEVKA